MVTQEKCPLVSIIMTSYNRENFIEKAIQSVLEQDYLNLEIIISDNNSTDKTDEIIKKYCTDSRIKYTRNEKNIGMLPNFKKATNELANGDLITYVSSDDYLDNEHFISDAVNQFNTYKSLVAFSGVSKNYYFNSKIKDHNSSYSFKENHNFFNKIISGKVVFDAFKHAHILNFGGTVFYKKDIIALDVFREPNTTYADLQAILLLALKGDFYFSDKVSYVQTFHDENASGILANADKALLNLSFADVPYNQAIKINFLEKEALDKWHYEILKPVLIHSMIHLLTTSKNDYKKFISNVSKKLPAIFVKLQKNKKWKLLTLIYSSKVLRILYSKFNTIRSAGK